MLLSHTSHGRKRRTVNIDFIFANLCKHFTQKWSVTRLRTDHLLKLLFLRVFADDVFFDYRDADIEY